MVRNRWAHSTTKGVPTEETYRDLDTLQRFCTVIGAPDTLVREVRAAKMAFLSSEDPSSGQGEAVAPSLSRGTNDNDVEFEPGQIVRVRSDPTIRGAVIAVLPGRPENRVKVFVSGDTQTYYASQLQSEVLPDGLATPVPCEQFHAHLTALQIRHPGLSTLYSLNAARVDFIPYQFRPVLRFIRSDRPRLLIADGVGVGKTIEAGLILRELQARRDVRSILIICPRPLVTERKWQNEMKRFEERFVHLDGGTLRYCINEMDLEGAWPEQYQKAIIPYSLFDEVLLYGTRPDGRRKQQKGLLDLDPPPRFDLVIVDEAHHIRNQETFSHRAVRFFCDHAEAVVFLTATPIQIGNNDLFVLLNTLRPDLIIDQESFEHIAAPNPFINRAVSLVRSQEPQWAVRALEALDLAAATAWGRAILQHNPEFNRIRSVLAGGNVDREKRVQLITDIEALHTLSGIINRTRRRDIGEFSIRKPETIAVAFTPSQQRFHDALLRVQSEILSRLRGDISVAFMMTTIRRQAASCLYGLVPFLKGVLNRHLDELEWDEVDNTSSVPQSGSVDPIRSQIEAILEMSQSLDARDPKFEALRNTLQDKQELPNNKVMVFSSFRHTLHYLLERLQADGFRVGMVHGGTPDEDRVALRNRFAMAREREDCLDVLLFSEIGCEGLDYQSCDCIVNYDLPWNPMRIEQRIGRIDRKGQRSESVAIVNLVTPGTIDADIYERCLWRLGVFERALGGSEEVLGDISREIRDIAENFALTDEERVSKLEQLADNKIRLIREQEELEQRQIELFGIRFPEEQIKEEIEAASSFWLSPPSIRRLVTMYLQRMCGRDQEFILGDKALKTLRLAQDVRSDLLHHFQQLPRQNTIAYREWEAWLKGANPHLPVTFESECAVQHPDAAFLMPLHPLVKQAAMSFDTAQCLVARVSAHSDDVPVGQYKFAIYQWRFVGIREDLVLHPIASSEMVTAQLERLLETAVDATGIDTSISGYSAWDELDARHHDLWSEAREKHRQRTRELAQYRKESLSTSHRARISLLEEQLNQANNEKIRIMRQSQITAAEADFARHIQEINIAIERADIVAQPVAYGVIHIEKGASDAE